MPRIVADGLTFVTNNARDFRKLFAREPIHAGLIIIVPQVTPSLQRSLFTLVLDELDSDASLRKRPVQPHAAFSFWLAVEAKYDPVGAYVVRALYVIQKSVTEEIP